MCHVIYLLSVIKKTLKRVNVNIIDKLPLILHVRCIEIELQQQIETCVRLEVVETVQIDDDSIFLVKYLYLIK